GALSREECDEISATYTDSKARRGTIVLLVLLALTTALALALAIVSYVGYPYNEERLAPALAWAHGLRIFQVVPIGPLLCNIYGPTFYLLYAPAALFKHATHSLAFGTIWSLLLYSLPVLYYAVADRRFDGFRRIIPILCFFTLSLSSYWPRHVMLAI